MNLVILAGANIVRMQTMMAASGNKVTRGTVASKRRYTVEKDPAQQDADFPSFVAFGKTAEFMEKYLHKGSRVNITGHLQTGSYTNKDGQKVYTTDVVVDRIEFAETKKEADEAAASAPADETAAAPAEEPIPEDLPFS